MKTLGAIQLGSVNHQNQIEVLLFIHDNVIWVDSSFSLQTARPLESSALIDPSSSMFKCCSVITVLLLVHRRAVSAGTKQHINASLCLEHSRITNERERARRPLH